MASSSSGPDDKKHSGVASGETGGPPVSPPSAPLPPSTPPPEYSDDDADDKADAVEDEAAAGVAASAADSSVVTAATSTPTSKSTLAADGAPPAPANAGALGASPATLATAFADAKMASLNFGISLARYADELPRPPYTPDNEVRRILERDLYFYRGVEVSPLARGLDAMRTKLINSLPPGADPREVNAVLSTLDAEIETIHNDLLENKGEFNQKAWEANFQKAQADMQKALAKIAGADPAKMKTADKAFTEDLQKLQNETSLTHFNQIKEKSNARAGKAITELVGLANGDKPSHSFFRTIDGMPKGPKGALEISAGAGAVEDGYYRKPGSYADIMVKNGKATAIERNLDDQWAQNRSWYEHPALGFIRKPLAVLAGIASLFMPDKVTSPGTFMKMMRYAWDANRPTPNERADLVETDLAAFNKEKYNIEVVPIESVTYFRHMDLDRVIKRMENMMKLNLKVELGENVLKAVHARPEKEQDAFFKIRDKVNANYLAKKEAAGKLLGAGLSDAVKAQADGTRNMRASSNLLSTITDALKGKPKLDAAGTEALKKSLSEGTSTERLEKAKAAATAIEGRLTALKDASEKMKVQIEKARPEDVVALQTKLDQLQTEIMRESTDLPRRAAIVVAATTQIREAIARDEAAHPGADPAARTKLGEADRILSDIKEDKVKAEADAAALVANNQMDKVERVIEKVREEKEEKEKAATPSAPGGPAP